jgi:hypothetical protein
VPEPVELDELDEPHPAASRAAATTTAAAMNALLIVGPALILPARPSSISSFPIVIIDLIGNAFIPQLT